MKPVTNEQEFLNYQMSRLVEQQEKTNQLLEQLIKVSVPVQVAATPKSSRKKTVEPTEQVINDESK